MLRRCAIRGWISCAIRGWISCAIRGWISCAIRGWINRRRPSRRLQSPTSQKDVMECAL